MRNNSTVGGQANDMYARGHAQRNVTLVQPVKFLLDVVGYSPSRRAGIYRALIGLLLLCECVCLFWITWLPQNLFTRTTMTGIAIASLAPLVAFPAVGRYMRARDLDEEVSLCQKFDPSTQRSIRGMAAQYMIGAALVSVTAVVYWNVNLRLALDNNFSRPATYRLFYLQIVPSIFSLSTIIFAVAILWLVCAVHRMQCRLLIQAMANPRANISLLIKMHHAVRMSIRNSSHVFTNWLFPVAIVLTFSALFQFYGYFRETQEASQYNGIYYVVAIFIIVYAMAAATTSVTATSVDVLDAASALYITRYDVRNQISFMLTYMRNADSSFKVFSVRVDPAVTTWLVILFFAAAGGFIRNRTI